MENKLKHLEFIQGVINRMAKRLDFLMLQSGKMQKDMVMIL